jgi:O-antigen ligase
MLELPLVAGWPRLLDRFTRWFPAAVVLALPLELSKQLFPIELLDVSRLLLLLGAAVLALQVLVLRRPLRFPSQPSFLLLVAFVGLATVSWALTRSAEGLKTTAALYAYLVLLLLVYNWARDEPAIVRTWRALAISGLVIGLLGTALFAAGVSLWSVNRLPRAYATFADPNIYGRFLVLTAAAGIVVAAQAGSRSWRWLGVAAAGCAGVAIPFTFSRQGYALFLVAIAGAVLVTRRRVGGALAAGAAVAGFVLIVALFPSTLTRLADAAQHALINYRLPDERVTDLGWADRLPLDTQRRYLIAAGVRMFADHPLAGVGHGGFQHAMETTYGAYVQPGYFDVVSHTSLVTILAEEGLLGLLLFLALTVQVIRETWRCARSATGDGRQLALAAALMLALILVASQLEERLFTEPYLWLFLGLFYAAQAGRSLDWARRPSPVIRAAASRDAAAVPGRAG